MNKNELDKIFNEIQDYFDGYYYDLGYNLLEKLKEEFEKKNAKIATLQNEISWTDFPERMGK